MFEPQKLFIYFFILVLLTFLPSDSSLSRMVMCAVNRFWYLFGFGFFIFLSQYIPKHYGRVVPIYGADWKEQNSEYGWPAAKEDGYSPWLWSDEVLWYVQCVITLTFACYPSVTFTLWPWTDVSLGVCVCAPNLCAFGVCFCLCRQSCVESCTGNLFCCWTIGWRSYHFPEILSKICHTSMNS